MNANRACGRNKDLEQAINQNWRDRERRGIWVYREFHYSFALLVGIDDVIPPQGRSMGMPTCEHSENKSKPSELCLPPSCVSTNPDPNTNHCIWSCLS